MLSKRRIACIAVAGLLIGGSVAAWAWTRPPHRELSRPNRGFVTQFQSRLISAEILQPAAEGTDRLTIDLDHNLAWLERLFPDILVGDSGPALAETGDEFLVEIRPRSGEPRAILVARGDAHPVWIDAMGRSHSVAGNFTLFMTYRRFATITRGLKTSDPDAIGHSIDRLKASEAQLASAWITGLQSDEMMERRQAMEGLTRLVELWAGTISHYDEIAPSNEGRRALQRAYVHDRPVESQIREACLAMIDDVMARASEPASPANRQQQSIDRGALNSSTSALSLVVNAEVIDRCIPWIEKAPSVEMGAPLMKIVDLYYGLPPTFESGGGLCGVGLTEEVARKFAEKEHARFQASRAVQLTYHAAHRSDSFEARVPLAMNATCGRLFHRDNLRGTPEGRQADQRRRLRGLIRLGPEAVPFFRDRMNATDDYFEKGMWAFLIATISGEVDRDFVATLRKDSPETRSIDRFYRERLAEDIVAAGNTPPPDDVPETM